MDASPLRLIAVLLVGFLLQITLFSQLRLFGVSPEIPIMLAVLTGMFIGFEQAAPIVFGLGLLYDVATNTPFGSWALVCLVAAYPLGVAAEHMDRKTGVALWLIGGLFTFLGVCAFVMLTWLLGRTEYSHGVPKIALIASVYNLILWPAFTFALAFALTGGSGRRRPRNSFMPRQGFRL